MPTYEYECTRCGHRFERFQSMTEEPVRRCPKCRCKVRRLFGTGAGVLFKGGGFYETDYRSESYKKAAEKEKSTATTTDSGKKGESKKDTGSSSKPKAAAKPSD
jgi:putative FmdB family regulatory protein